MKAELRAIFLAEGRGLLQQLREGLKTAGERPEKLPELFRCAHMLKGDVNFADLRELQLVVSAVSEALKAAKDAGALDVRQAELLGMAVAACQELLEGRQVPDLLALLGELTSAASAQAARPAQARLRILLVEDSDLQARVIEKELGEARGSRFSVSSAANLAAGLGRLDEGGVDAVLLDLNLPDSQGADTFLALNARAPDVPVVILTISDDDALALEALRQGAQDYLVKGQLDSKLLSRVIRYSIERKRLEVSLRRAREELEQRVRERTADLTRANETLRRKSADLERTNGELQLFASVASHELREPVRQIVIWGDMLKRRCAPALDADGLRFLDNMQRAAMRQGELIRSLRELTSVTMATTPFEPLELAQVVKDALTELEPLVSAAGGRVEAGSLPAVRGDAVQLGQLFRNLLKNSLKYRAKDKPLLVRIAGRRSGRLVEVSVEDNGVGFEQKFAERLFKPFQRLHNRTDYEGLGMGLAICARIVWRHGGTISARGEPGRGATITLTLPALQL